MAVALAAADTYVVVLALTDMMTGVGLGIDALQKATPIISGFLLGYVAVLPLIGRLADLVPRQRILLACLLIFVVGSAITALAVELPVLVTGRVLQGIGGGGLVPATLAIVADLWPAGPPGYAARRGGCRAGGGQRAGTRPRARWCWRSSDWRAIFWLNVVAGLVLAGLVVALRRRPAVAATGAAPRARRRGPGDGGLALAAPERLVDRRDARARRSCRSATRTSRLATPDRRWWRWSLVVAWLVAVTCRSWWPLLRRADLPGALLLGAALGASSSPSPPATPSARWSARWGSRCCPSRSRRAGLYLWRHRTAASRSSRGESCAAALAPRSSSVPAGRCRPGRRRSSTSRCSPG